MASDWKNVGRIKGEDGKDGAKGDKGDKGDKGETGEKGTDGTNGAKGATGNPLIIKDTLDSESDLPSDGEAGNAYIIDGNLYVYQ